MLETLKTLFAPKPKFKPGPPPRPRLGMTVGGREMPAGLSAAYVVAFRAIKL